MTIQPHGSVDMFDLPYKSCHSWINRIHSLEITYDTFEFIVCCFLPVKYFFTTLFTIFIGVNIVIATQINYQKATVVTHKHSLRPRHIVKWQTLGKYPQTAW